MRQSNPIPRTIKGVLAHGHPTRLCKPSRIRNTRSSSRSFDAEHAWQIGSQLREMALARGAAVAIDVRTFGRKLFLPRSTARRRTTRRWIERKSRTVEHFRRSSYAIGLALQQAGTTLADKYGLDPAEFASHGGAFPVARGGRGRDRFGRGVGSAAARRSSDGRRSAMRGARRELRPRSALTSSASANERNAMRSSAFGLLAMAIVAEVVATSALRASDGFTRLVPAADRRGRDTGCRSICCRSRCARCRSASCMRCGRARASCSSRSSPRCSSSRCPICRRCSAWA